MAVTAAPPDDVTSGQVEATTAAGAESAAAEAESDEDFLWLWYAVLTVVLLALILASFVRFHYRRVQQQKLRLDAELTYGVTRHATTPSPGSAGNHVTSAAATAMTPAAVVNLDMERLLANDVGAHANDPKVRGHHRTSRGREDGDLKRAPVVYTFNANGSMVWVDLV